MKKLLLVLIAGFALSTTTIWAAGSGARVVDAAAAHPTAVQTGASAIAARPAAQSAMDKSMAANPKANAVMVDVQKAGGYTPPPK